MDKTKDKQIDIDALVEIAKYWMEHYRELILNVPNPFVKASLFGQIFEDLPTFDKLNNGTPKLSPLFALSALSTKGIDLQCGVNGTSLEQCEVTVLPNG